MSEQDKEMCEQEMATVRFSDDFGTAIGLAGVNPAGDYHMIQVDADGYAILSKQDRETLARIESNIAAVLARLEKVLQS